MPPPCSRASSRCMSCCRLCFPMATNSSVEAGVAGPDAASGEPVPMPAAAPAPAAPKTGEAAGNGNPTGGSPRVARPATAGRPGRPPAPAPPPPAWPCSLPLSLARNLVAVSEGVPTSTRGADGTPAEFLPPAAAAAAVFCSCSLRSCCCLNAASRMGSRRRRRAERSGRLSRTRAVTLASPPLPPPPPPCPCGWSRPSGDGRVGVLGRPSSAASCKRLGWRMWSSCVRSGRSCSTGLGLSANPWSSGRLPSGLLLPPPRAELLDPRPAPPPRVRGGKSGARSKTERRSMTVVGGKAHTSVLTRTPGCRLAPALARAPKRLQQMRC